MILQIIYQLLIEMLLAN